ncbi:MAG TPA: hypothetical protein ENJ43_05315 [Gammaproteobacteria bacterium]|nr:hypothetical protein [Gammaproteobacteria bacterium]
MQSAVVNPRTIPEPWVGVTIDSVSNLGETIASLQALSVKPVVRVVFGKHAPAADYVETLDELRPVSYVMGKFLDSFYVKDYDRESFRARAREYLDVLGGRVDVWEIGNEINGEWLGETETVAGMMIDAFELVRERGGKSALTLYYNEGCWEDPAAEMFRWAGANIPEEMKIGLDYVLVSYYEDDCYGLQPDWPKVFGRLGEMFPNSKLGFGEVGTKYSELKESYIRRYYGMDVDHPNFIGGYFWWYFRQDMVPSGSPLWQVLNETIQ